MGCDIHMYIEWRNKGLPWQADEHHHPTIQGNCSDTHLKPEDFCDNCKNGGTPEKCRDSYLEYRQVSATCRSYPLFAALAGVRGSGPESKDLPYDVSPVIAAAARDYGSDGHSHSYVSLEEFKAIINEQKWEPSDSCDAFYKRWGDGSLKYDDRPPYYTTIINYCEKLKQEKNLDKHLFDNDMEPDVEIRLVFWFDN